MNVQNLGEPGDHLIPKMRTYNAVKVEVAYVICTIIATSTVFIYRYTNYTEIFVAGFHIEMIVVVNQR